MIQKKDIKVLEAMLTTEERKRLLHFWGLAATSRIDGESVYWYIFEHFWCQEIKAKLLSMSELFLYCVFFCSSFFVL